MPLSAADCGKIRQVLKGRGTNYRNKDVARWLEKAGFQPPRNVSGSHRVWRHHSGRRIVLVDRGKGDILAPYVKNAAKILLEVGACPD